MSSDKNNINVLIIDDHALLCEALRDLLIVEGDFTVIGELPGGVDALSEAARTRPDIILVDIDNPYWDPADIVRSLLSASPRSRVIVMSLYGTFHHVQAVMKAGASGYLHKSVGKHEVARSIRIVHKGKTVIMGDFHSRRRPTAENLPARLSERELEVLSLVARAKSNRQIGAELGITESTVKRHMRNIFTKLGAVSRIDAVNKVTSAAQTAPAARRVHRPSPRAHRG
jgi:two-component system nitrate/nitrite response regulator NarL